MPYRILKDGDRFCVHLLGDDDLPGAVVEGGCHDDEAAAEAHLKALYAAVGEPAATVSAPTQDVPPLAPVFTMRDTYVTELRSIRPDVPFFPEVDIAALTAGDAAPTYVTMRIAAVGRRGRGLYELAGQLLPLEYDESLVNDIERQVREKRPGACMGHPDKYQQDTLFPIPEAMWVGATRVGNVLWGKAYIRDAAVAEYVRDQRAVKGKLAVSIIGKSQLLADGAVARARGLDLERIDFAPPERASVDLGGEFYVTAEMTDPSQLDKDTTVNEDLKQALADLSANDLLDALGAKAQGVAEAFLTRTGQTVVPQQLAEIARGAETTARELNLQIETQKRVIAEQSARLQQFEAEQFKSGLDALIEKATPWKAHANDARGESRIASFRAQLRRGVLAELAGATDLKQADVTIAELMTGDLQGIAETIVESLNGPVAPVGGKGKDAKAAITAWADGLMGRGEVN